MTPDWPQLIQDHSRLVVGVVRQIVGNDQDTEDVVQEVFWEAYRAGERQVIISWPGFLRRVAICRALDLVRCRRFHLPIEPDAITDSSSGPVQIATDREMVDRLRSAIATLPSQEAQVFCLKYFEELSYEEIAQSLSISTNAAGLALHKARKKLHSFFDTRV